MKPLLPGIVRVKGLGRAKESLVNFLPIDRVESKTIPCGIHDPEVAALPTVSHWARETLSLDKLTGADCLILAIVHGLKKCFKSFIILYAPVVEVFRPIFRLFEKKPPRRCMRKFDRGGVCKLPVHHSDNVLSFIDENILWSEVIAPDWKWASLMAQLFHSQFLVSDESSEEKSRHEFSPAVILRVNSIVPLTYQV